MENDHDIQRNPMQEFEKFKIPPPNILNLSYINYRRRKCDRFSQMCNAW